MQAPSHVLRPGWALCAVVGSFETTLTGQGCTEVLPANEIAAPPGPGCDLRDTKRAASSSSAIQATRLVPCGADDDPGPVMYGNKATLSTTAHCRVTGWCAVGEWHAVHRHFFGGLSEQSRYDAMAESHHQ
jgi:hypothetical protein